MFFCCDICADIFQNMIAEVKRRRGWENIDGVELHGNYGSGRNCLAYSGKSQFKYYFRTYGDGRMMKFEER